MDFLLARTTCTAAASRDAPRPRPRRARRCWRRRVRAHGEQHHLRDVRRGDVLLGLLPRRGGMGPDAGVGLRRRGREQRRASRRARASTATCRPPASSSSSRSASSEHGFFDASAHRARLPAAYNCYPRVDADPGYDPGREDQQMLLRPLFFTSYLIDDFLADSGLFGAGMVVLSSASSKTASGLAYLLSPARGRRGRRPHLAAQRRLRARARRLRPTSSPTRSSARCHAGAPSMSTWRATRTCAAPCTATTATSSPTRRSWARPITTDGRRSRVAARARARRSSSRPTGSPSAQATGGARGSNAARRGVAALREWTDGWLEVIHERGPEALRAAYLDLLDGRIDPARAHVLTLQPS